MVEGCQVGRTYKGGGTSAAYQSCICWPVQCSTPSCRSMYSYSCFEIFDAVRGARHIGVHADGQHARRLGRLLVQPVERVGAALEQDVGLVMVRHHQRDVVDLGAVGHGQDRAVRRPHPDRLVVEHPVAEPGEAAFGGVIERLVGLAAAGPEPAGRLPAGESLDQLDRLPHHRALVLDLLDRHLHVAVGHELPVGVAGGRRDLGIGLADLGIDRHGRRDARLLERALEPPEADPHAVLVPGPVRQVGDRRLPHRRLRQLPRHRPGDLPFLDVDHRPHDHAALARQLERRPREWRRVTEPFAGILHCGSFIVRVIHRPRAGR